MSALSALALATSFAARLSPLTTVGLLPSDFTIGAFAGGGLAGTVNKVEELAATDLGPGIFAEAVRRGQSTGPPVTPT